MTERECFQCDRLLRVPIAAGSPIFCNASCERAWREESEDKAAYLDGLHIALAMEARRAATTKIDAVHDSAGPKGQRHE